MKRSVGYQLCEDDRILQCILNHREQIDEAFLYRNTGARGRISNVDGSLANHTASQLIRYLQQHYQEPVSSALLAETFNYHAYHIPLL